MAPRNVPQTATLTIAAGPGAVGAAVTLARRFVGDTGLAEDIAARLEIVVEELVANLVEYGELAAGDVLRVELRRRDTDVVLVLSDPGPPFDPRRAPPPGELPPARGGGAGLALVNAWARIESYTRVSGINRLSLTLGD